ncbi:MAG: hypothetical protein AB7O57_02855 [Hyphomicrobiaceae bacterium]
MKTNPTMGALRWLSLFAGMIVTGATVAILAGDAITTGQWGRDQWLGLVILFSTILFGLLGKGAWRTSRLASLAFYAMFAVGTLLLVYSSVGRQHGTRATLAAAVTGANEHRADLIGERKRIDGQIAGLKAELARFRSVRSTLEIKGAMDAIVGNGPGKVPAAVWRRTKSCSAGETTRDVSAAACQPIFDLRIENGRALEREAIERKLDAAEGDRKAVLAKLEDAGAEQVMPDRAKPFAEIVGLFGFSADRVERIMSKIDALLATLFLEISAVVALEFAFGGIIAAAGAREARPVQAEPIAVAPVAIVEDDEPTPPGARRPRGNADPELGNKIVSLFADGRAPNQSEIAASLGVHPSTVSRELVLLEKAGRIRRISDGRSKRIAVA